MPTDSLPGNRVQLRVEMPAPKLYVARIEPYRLSDLDRLLESIREEPRVQITPIGKTAGGRELEIIRIGNAGRAVSRVRARPGASMGIGQQLGRAGADRSGCSKDDDEARRFLRVYSVYILPMANKDGVARGGTRFNLRGKDLNRNWDKPADPELSPENAALEQWLERHDRGRAAAAPRDRAAQRRQRPAAHQPAAGAAARSSSRADGDLRRAAARKTWFTEGSTNAAFRNSGTLGDGWLQRYGIDAVVHEFNCNWIEG